MHLMLLQEQFSGLLLLEALHLEASFILPPQWLMELYISAQTITKFMRSTPQLGNLYGQLLLEATSSPLPQSLTEPSILDHMITISMPSMLQMEQFYGQLIQEMLFQARQ